MSPETLNNLLQGHTPFALIDVREVGEYNSSHIPGASVIPRRQLEFQMSQAVPYKGAPVVLCDDDARRAHLAAALLERMGYGRVAVLEGGINRWVSQNYPTQWGSNVPSKDFGEQMEAVYHVPEIEAAELHARMERGEKLVILDTRTPEEHQRFCIPGGRSMRGAGGGHGRLAGDRTPRGERLVGRDAPADGCDPFRAGPELCRRDTVPPLGDGPGREVRHLIAKGGEPCQ